MRLTNLDGLHHYSYRPRRRRAMARRPSPNRETLLALAGAVAWLGLAALVGTLIYLHGGV